MRRARLWMVLAPVGLGLLAGAQTGRPAPGTPTFEAVSVKPGDPNAINGRFNLEPGGRFTCSDTPLRSLIQNAFGLTDRTRLLGPGWIDSARYSIDAVPPEGLPALHGSALQQRWQAILRQLLVDRFRLVTHNETREAQVYELVVAEGGSKFPPPGQPGEPPPVVGPTGPDGKMLDATNGEVSSIIAGIQYLPGFLGGQLGRPVVDKTGITGAYQIRLVWLPEPGERNAAPSGSDAPEASGPSIYTAVEEQLGLRLRAARDPVDFVVIDRVERPSGND